MEDLDQKRTRIEDSSERFPAQMIFVNEVFSFSFNEIGKVTKRLGSNAELIDVIQQTRSFIAQSELSDETKQLMDALLQEEIEVISFSQTNRSSVISL
jgi:hypothetical protein